MESDFSENKGGDSFVTLHDEKQCVDECTDIGNALQDVIVSFDVGGNSESDNDDIWCQEVTNAEVRKSMSLLHQFMTE